MNPVSSSASLKHQRSGDRERGAFLVMAALSLTVMLGFLALSIDMGNVYQNRRAMQTAADAAATAAAHDLLRGNASLASGTARAVAAAHGFSHGSAGSSVSVSRPPASGPSAGDPRFVEVVVRKPVPAFLPGLFDRKADGVSARAVASASANGTSCVVVLDPSAQGAIDLYGGGKLDAPCGITVNSSNSRAITLTGASTSMTAGSIAMLGGVSATGNPTITPTPVKAVAPALDPLATMPAPDVDENCDRTNFKTTKKVTTIAPGVYCGGIAVQSSSVLRLEPGLYVLKGGGLTVDASSEITGTDVTFYLTRSSKFAYGPVSINSSAKVVLRAPRTTNGDDESGLPGILFFQDRAVTTANITNRFGSSSTLDLEGVLYFPNQRVEFTSNTGGNALYLGVIAARLTLGSGAFLRLRNDYSALPGGSPLKTVALVE
jgi:hypothetical protein